MKHYKYIVFFIDAQLPNYDTIRLKGEYQPAYQAVLRRISVIYYLLSEYRQKTI